MSEVLVIGESLVDVVRDGQTESRHAGGSPMNVAYGLAQLGVETTLLTRIGSDPDGALIQGHLERAGVALHPASLREQATSTAVATIGADGSATYSFDISWDLAPVTDVAAPWLHVGSISTFLAPGADAVQQYLESSAARVSYDPNIRAALLGDPQAARERFEAIARLTSVLKLSDEDARWLYPDRDESSVVDLLLSLGPAVVAVTRGASGALLASSAHRVDVPAVAVSVKDTVGAGDTFMAALISTLRDLELETLSAVDLHEAGSFAAAAAALTCSRVGADLPTRAEVLAQV